MFCAVYSPRSGLCETHTMTCRPLLNGQSKQDIPVSGLNPHAPMQSRPNPPLGLSTRWLKLISNIEAFLLDCAIPCAAELGNMTRHGRRLHLFRYFFQLSVTQNFHTPRLCRFPRHYDVHGCMHSLAARQNRIHCIKRACNRMNLRHRVFYAKLFKLACRKRPNGHDVHT